MIYEDPDNLGYFSTVGGWGHLHTLAKCNAILPGREQDIIEAAARLEHQGLPFAAENVRFEADYQLLGVRSDADGSIP